MTDKQPEALIRADELEAIGAESSLARAMAAHTIRLLYKENEALRARLAQPEPKPVAWIVHEDGVRGLRWSHPRSGMLKVEPLYYAPPQREWQGLTMEETELLIREAAKFREGYINADFLNFAKLVAEVGQLLKEKNS